MVRSFRACGALVAALFVVPAANAGTSLLCPLSDYHTSLAGPARGSRHLVGSEVEFHAVSCFVMGGQCAPTGISIRAGIHSGGEWLTGPSTIAVGGGFGGGAQATGGVHALTVHGRVHVAAEAYGCDGLEFIAQDKPTVVATVTTPAIPHGTLGYHVVGQNIVLSAVATIDTAWALSATPSYAWTLDDGTTASTADVTVAFGEAGEYFPSVIASDGTFESEPSALNIWVRGPAQAPDWVSEFQECREDRLRPTVELAWERTGTSFELQRYANGAWKTIYAGPDPQASFQGQPRSLQSLRVRASDADYGPTSDWKQFQVRVISCDLVDPNL